MKNKYQFAFKGEDGLWGLEETKEITQADWDKFAKEMNSLVDILKNMGQPNEFKAMGPMKKKCVFDK